MNDTALKPALELATLRTAPFPGETDEYTKARLDLLAAEIELRRQTTRVAEQRQALPPGPVVDKDYRFKDDNGEVGLGELFGDHDTLITYFWMFGPQRDRPCPMCTNWLGGVNGNAADVKQRAALKILGRSPLERQKAFAVERGWRDLDFVETVGDDFADDLDLIDEDGNESPAFVVFTKDGDQVRVFYSGEMPFVAADPDQDPRSAPEIAPLWNLLEFTPAGRGTDWYPSLSY
ncbi:MAG: DUF899 family protein [Ilumatobacteraceae bacterium]